jgi:hypothetical protein
VLKALFAVFCLFTEVKEKKRISPWWISQQSPQRLVDRNEHMNRRRNRMILWLKPLQVV